MDRINDASLRQWLAIPARVAVEEFLAAAAELEGLISRLDAAIVSELVTEGRERLVDRSLHRGGSPSNDRGSIPLRVSDQARGRRQSRSMSRWSTETRCPRSRKYSARSSATTTERWRPPVQPTATVR